ncbi:FAD/NAD(P)-binding domain-containing protein, partial [Rhizopogon vinicolor AM-OR11-026]
MSFNKDFRVAIVGGGICGLACAGYLSRAGIHVDLFESASIFKEIGAGVDLGRPNAVRALDFLGLTETVLAHANLSKPEIRPFRFISALAGHQLIHDYETLPEDLGFGIHRPAFMDALAGLIDPSIIHFNKRCVSVTKHDDPGRGASIIHFADGTTFEAEVVLGADGIRSTVRRTVTEQHDATRVVFSRTVVYRALLPLEDILQAGVQIDFSRLPHNLVGVNKHLIIYPMRNGKIINVVIFYTDKSIPEGTEIPVSQWVTSASTQELLEAFDDCGPEVKKILSLIEKPSKWAIHSVDPPLDKFSRGSVALIGDAAHGMCPHLGAGVGQGLEDVRVICELLTHPQARLSNIESVLEAYDFVRQPRANMILRRSVWAGELYE